MSLIHIEGHLGADPEVRFTSSGLKVTTLRVAARARKGKEEDNTIWWRVTVWGDQYDKMMNYLKKGSAVMVVGEIHKPEIFTNRDGNPQVSMSVTAIHLRFPPFGRSDRQEMNNKESEQAAPAAQSYDSGFSAGKNSDSSEGFSLPSDDEIPF